MKRTFQPSQRRRRNIMASVPVWQLQMVAVYWQHVVHTVVKN